MQKIWFILILGSFSGLTVRAQQPQDTLRLRLPEAEKMFLDSNLQLLAQRYSIDAEEPSSSRPVYGPIPISVSGIHYIPGRSTSFSPQEKMMKLL